jgi:MFS family permease
VSRRLSFWIVAATFGLFLFAASAPSPLYAVYAARWQFSAVALTEVFAVYAIALLIALVLTGSLSDSLGRRPVILAGLLIQAASMVMFLLASDLDWLFAARVTQGIATGIVTSALAASLIDLQPADDPHLGSLVNSATPTGGLAFGGLVSGALAQYAPDPLHLVYWFMLGAFVAAGAGIALISEPGSGRTAIRLMPRVGVEPSVRSEFVAGLPSLIAVWSLGGFYLSLGPSLALQLAGSRNRLLGGLAIFLLAGSGSWATVALRSWPARRAMGVGGTALLSGLLIGITALAVTSASLFFIATAIAGAGFGLAFLGTFRTLVALAAPSARGALIAAIYVVAYLAFALPAVVAGYFVTRIGLHNTALYYGGVVGALALAGLVGTLIVGTKSRDIP